MQNLQDHNQTIEKRYRKINYTFTQSIKDPQEVGAVMYLVNCLRVLTTGTLQSTKDKRAKKSQGPDLKHTVLGII